MRIAELLMQAAAIYAAIGLISGVIFILFALDRIDPAARRSWAFRPLLLPGFVLIWPLALWRWFTCPRSEA